VHCINVVVPEWLSGMTRNHVGFARAGSNPADHAFYVFYRFAHPSHNISNIHPPLPIAKIQNIRPQRHEQMEAPRRIFFMHTTKITVSALYTFDLSDAMKLKL
jgi:hypothetical protein